jgi:phage terminase large subunit-like protein
MPLKLTVGLAKKVGQPNYGSLGATCGVEVELENSLLGGDPDAFRARVRDAFVACRRAVDDELERLQAAADAPLTNGHAESCGSIGNGRANGHGTIPTRSPSTSGPVRRSATPRQIRTIVAIARRQRANLESLLRTEYGKASLEELSLVQASRLIDGLRAAAVT